VHGFMTVLGKITFTQDDGPGRWVLRDFDGFLLAEIKTEVQGAKGISAAFEKMKEECAIRFPNARVHSRSALEYLVTS
jgi:hypothetical protein